MNLVLMTADDLSYTSTGPGGGIPGTTRNLDRLGREGVWFENAHTVVSLCQPSRAVHMTGLYPWNNGSVGFCPLAPGVATLPMILKKCRYTTGLIGKNIHYTPTEQFGWDFSISGYSSYQRLFGDQTVLSELAKNPDLLGRAVESFLAYAPRPFFLSVNCHHPHRPFPDNTRYSPDQSPIPGFLPDCPEVRQDLAHYFEGVSRCDEAIGVVAEAVRKAKDTLLVFTSDHGMAFPFVKAHCYPFSTRVPLVFWNPATIKSKSITALTSSVDLFTTLLELLGIKHTMTDGRSYVETLHTGEPYRNHIYTSLDWCNTGPYPTRAVHDQIWCFVRNLWYDSRHFHEDGSLEGQLALAGLKHHARHLYRHLRIREAEELYNLETDPFCRHNLVSDHDLRGTRDKYLELMRRYAMWTTDPLRTEIGPPIHLL